MDLSTFTTITPLTIDHAHAPDTEATILAIQQRLADPAPPRHIYNCELNNISPNLCISDSFEKYLSYPAIQSSHMKAAKNTALHYAFSKSDEKKLIESLSPDKTYFNIGTYLHQCLLEPTLFSRALVEPDYGTNTTEGCNKLIEFWESKCSHTPQIMLDGKKMITDIFGLSLDKIDGKRKYLFYLKTNSGYTSVNAADYEKIKILKLHSDHYGVSPHTPHGIIRRLLHHSRREISFYAHDFEPGTSIKVRPDALQFKENIGVDAIISIKSTASEDISAFERYSATNHYDLTEALYQDVVSHVTGRDFRTTITIMLQTVDPYAIAVCIWSRDDIDRGRQKYRDAIATIQLADSTGIYPGYESLADNPLGIIELVMPKWNNLEEKSKW